MILELELFNSLPPYSKKMIRVRCDECGKERSIRRDFITRRQVSTYDVCDPCKCKQRRLGQPQHPASPEGRARQRAALIRYNQSRVITDQMKQKIGNANRKHAPGGYALKRKQASRFHNLLRAALDRCSVPKQGSSRALLGYGANELARHLENQFTAGMGWANRGTFTIDHIFPVSAFIDHGITDPRIVNCLANLRPLSPKENMSKADRYDLAQFSAWLEANWGICLSMQQFG